MDLNPLTSAAARVDDDVMEHQWAPGLACLVVNAGGTYHPHKDWAAAWADRVASSAHAPDLVFAQEAPDDSWLEAWGARGYRVILGHPRGWKVRSAILTRLPDDMCAGLSIEQVAELAYHGEYVAAARLRGWASGSNDLTLLSVHAQPQPTTATYLAHYPRPGEVLTRDGGDDPRHRGQLFDADVVLETISRHSPNVLACGDFNEARGWDHAPGHDGHTWGAEFFGTPDAEGQLQGGAVQRMGLVEVPLTATGEEVATRRAPNHPSLQLDHIVTSESLSTRVHDVYVDDDWTNDLAGANGLADHAPIWFNLASAN